MQHLQGDIIPYIIGVHRNVHGFNIAMELPHNTLWIIAHKDMSSILKQRCVSAFQKLQAEGILHGQPDLRHILLGADGKVIVIDFSTSRALVPELEVGLEKAEPAELAMELRIVKYKLDYDGAIAKETAKLERREKYTSWMEAERARQAAQVLGFDVGPAKPSPLTVEDLCEPPDAIENIERRWRKSSRDMSEVELEVVMPGRTADEIQAARSNLCNITSEDSPDTELVSRKRRATDDEPASSSKRRRTAEAIPSTEQTQVLPSSVLDSSLKRKATFEQDTSVKRLRAADAPDVSAVSQTAIDSAVPEVLPAIQRPPISYEITSSFSVDVTSNLPAASLSSNAARPPVKVRDFACETLDGQRGYYFPHPPTEGRMSIARALHIRWTNCLTALHSQPPTALHRYNLDKHRLTYAMAGSKVPQTSVSLGSLRRSWASPTVSSSNHSKSYQHALIDDLDDKPPRVFRCIDASGDFFQSSDTIQLTSKAKGRSRCSQFTSGYPLPSPRSILRSVPPSTTISYAKKDWPSVVLDAADGPHMIEVTVSEGPVLNSTVNLGLRSLKYLTNLELASLNSSKANPPQAAGAGGSGFTNGHSDINAVDPPSP